VVLGHGGDDGSGGVGEDRLAEVTRTQQGEIVATGKTPHPCRLFLDSHVGSGPLSPGARQLGEARMGLLRPGGDRGHLVQAHVLDRCGAAPVGGGELGSQGV
jgi:hypothetical protein